MKNIKKENILELTKILLKNYSNYCYVEIDTPN